MISQKVKLVECPRDAMQGIKDFIPTEKKVNYLNFLLQCGFDTLDFGSFVSPKAIPQLSDTEKVLSGLNLNDTETKLLAIIANEKGAINASNFDEINYLGYPFSISEEFQKRNTNTSIEGSLVRLEKINKIANTRNKELVIYISMGFGNPYGEKWSPDIVTEWVERLYRNFEIKTFSISDTIGCANEEVVSFLFETLIPSMKMIEFGAHMHVLPRKFDQIFSSAYNAGCRRFDGAIRGLGGCPMAKDKLIGNMATENIISWLDKNQINSGVNKNQFEMALNYSKSVIF